jgi:GH35 family endo-1,4-beta-xylanase
MKPPALFLAAALAGVSASGSLAADSFVPVDAAALGPFGIGSCHTNNRSAQDAARWIPQMEAIGLHYYRAGATGWSQVEPEEGKFDWKALDEQMSYLTAHGFVFGGLLNGGVRWNTADQPGTLPVNNLPAWSSYVSAIVQHTKGKIRRWEVWNEPPNGTGREQTAADYAKIVVAAYDAAKAIDPANLIGLATKSVHVNYLEQAIKAGAKDHFDYLTVHPYEVLNGIADNAGTEVVFMNIVPTIRKMLAVQNPAKAEVPIIFTELGCEVKKGADTQAHALVKAYTMGIAQGVECIQWFEGMDGDSGPMGLLDHKATPRPSYTALAQMIEHLGQHPAYLGWLLLNEKHYGFVFRGAESTVLIAWGRQGAAEEIGFGQSVQIVNPLTGDLAIADHHALNAAPILVLDVPQGLLEQAATNQNRPLPWGGDFTKVKAVSITMGEEHGERGLHTLSGDSLAQAVVAYGGSARAGNVPGGNVFVVDPGFLSYAATPIEITAVVRRNEANDNAGFKLVYESASGFKTARGWYTVPDNKQWHTVRWQIDDPQFVNYWGYNFALESDGNQFNKYYFQSVTVTKRTE